MLRGGVLLVSWCGDLWVMDEWWRFGEEVHTRRVLSSWAVANGLFDWSILRGRLTDDGQLQVLHDSNLLWVNDTSILRLFVH
jgi:hypothetical protein